MVDDALQQTVRLKNDFYRDGFYKVSLALGMVFAAVALLLALLVYLFLEKPQPVNFAVDNEWRILPPVALDQPYLNTPDLLQWVSDVLPIAFTYDFVNYDNQLRDVSQYFTADGWKKFLDLLNIYANSNTVQMSKQFINGNADGAPIPLNQGLLQGVYAWWVQMPIDIHYINLNKEDDTLLTVQVLVVRESTLNNLNGVAIDNIVVSKEKGTGPR